MNVQISDDNCHHLIRRLSLPNSKPSISLCQERCRPAEQRHSCVRLAAGGSEANIVCCHDCAVAGLPKLVLDFLLDLTQLWLPPLWSSVSPSGTAVHVRWHCGGDYMQGFVLKLKVSVSLSEAADPLLKTPLGYFCFPSII